jgi:hypothetical protein
MRWHLRRYTLSRTRRPNAIALLKRTTKGAGTDLNWMDAASAGSTEVKRQAELVFKVWPGPKAGRIGSRLRKFVRHNARVTNNEGSVAASVSTGLAIGMLIGIAVGLVLGVAVFDSVAVGLAVGGGAGGVLGATFPAARRSQRQS